MIEKCAQSGRTLLTEFESKQLLAFYGIPTVETRLAATEDEAVGAANSLGYPVALKLNSFTVTHKTDVGGVKLSLNDAAAVRAAYRDIQKAVTSKLGEGHFNGVTVQRMVSAEGYELIVGSSTDATVWAGALVWHWRAACRSLPRPGSRFASAEHHPGTSVHRTNPDFHGAQRCAGRKPVDIEALECLLVRFSQLVLEQNWIREIDINPLLASSETLLALDARVVLYAQETNLSEIPKPAIRPYPSKYAGEVGLEGQNRAQYPSHSARKTSRNLSDFTRRYRMRASTAATFT